MAEGVRATTFRLNAQKFEAAAHGSPHPGGRHRAVRLLQRHEDIATGAARPRLQITQDRFPDFVLKRIR